MRFGEHTTVVLINAGQSGEPLHDHGEVPGSVLNGETQPFNVGFGESYRVYVSTCKQLLSVEIENENTSIYITPYQDGSGWRAVTDPLCFRAKGEGVVKVHLIFSDVQLDCAFNYQRRDLQAVLSGKER